MAPQTRGTFTFTKEEFVICNWLGAYCRVLTISWISDRNTGTVNPTKSSRKNVDPSRKNRRKKHSYHEYECQRLDQQGHKVHRSGFHWETGKKILFFHTRREREKNTDPMFFFLLFMKRRQPFTQSKQLHTTKTPSSVGSLLAKGAPKI